MGLVFLPDKRQAAGLDIGASTVKLCVLQRKKGGLEPVKIEERAWSGDWDSAAGTDELFEILKSFAGSLKGPGLRLTVSLNSPATGIRMITMPPMPRKELHDALQLEARSYFPYAVEDSQVAFKILDEFKEHHTRRVRVMAAVMPGARIEKCLALLKRLHVRPVAIVPAAFSLHRFVSFLPASEALQKNREPQPRSDEVRCVLGLGGEQTECLILRGRNLAFARKIAVGGRDFAGALTEAVMTETGKVQLTRRDAAEILQKTGFVDASGEDQAVSGLTQGQIAAMLRGPLEQLADEVDRCFRYFHEEAGEGRIESLILYGGAALIPGFGETLSHALGIPVHVSPSALQAAAVGAALSEDRSFNFLPAPEYVETKTAVQRGFIEALIVAVALILGLSYIGLKIQAANHEKQARVLGKELSLLEPLIQEAHRQADRNLAAGDEPYWDEILKEISHAVPREIRLTEIQATSPEIFLRGTITSEQKEQTLSDFIRTLEKGVFSKVALVTTRELKDGKESEFEIKGRVTES